MPRADGKGRVPAVEVLLATARVRELIEDKDRTKEIPDAIAQGHTTYGMQTFDQSLMGLLKSNLITYEEALRQATNPDDFALRVSGISGTSDSKWDNFEKPPEAGGAAARAPAPPAPPRPRARLPPPDPLPRPVGRRHPRQGRVLRRRPPAPVAPAGTTTSRSSGSSRPWIAREAGAGVVPRARRPPAPSSRPWPGRGRSRCACSRSGRGPRRRSGPALAREELSAHADEVLAWLRGLGYLDDAAYALAQARALLVTRQARAAQGRAAAGPGGLGIAEARKAVRQVLEGDAGRTASSTERELCRTLAERRARRPLADLDDRERARLARFLAGRGFGGRGGGSRCWGSTVGGRVVPSPGPVSRPLRPPCAVGTGSAAERGQGCTLVRPLLSSPPMRRTLVALVLVAALPACATRYTSISGSLKLGSHSGGELRSAAWPR